MEVKHLIGIEEGDAVAAFVSQIEKKTGKSLRTVHIRRVVEEPVRYAEKNDSGITEVKTVLESSVNVSVEFFKEEPPPPNLTT